jgi:hypothetical protein
VTTEDSSLAEHNDPVEVLVQAFAHIEDKNALAWSILDTKSESAVVHAICVSANRRLGRRAANVEVPPYRLDLALSLRDGSIAAFEAKAGYLTDFQPKRIAKRDWYLGGCTDQDLGKLKALKTRSPAIRHVFGLFFAYQVSDPSKQQKYGKAPAVPLDDAKQALTQNVTLGSLLRWESIDCGEADRCRVNIHMAVFAPLADPAFPAGSPSVG